MTAVQAPNKTKVQIPSTDRKRMYTVDLEGRRCSCPAWKFTSPRRDCKHLKLFS